MNEEGYAFLLVCVVVGFIAFVSGVLIERSYWHEAAIKRDYAAYCPENGDFAWNNECGVKK